MDRETALEVLRKQAIAAAAAVDPDFAKAVAEQEEELAQMRKRDADLQTKKKEPKVFSKEEESWIKMQDLVNNRSRGG